jgi:cytochrome P450
MTPASPGENLRELLDGSMDIDGHFLPAGTLVGSAPWSLFHDEEFFGDGWTFRPERWNSEKDCGGLGVRPEDVARARSAFFPWSIGPSNCIGQKLAKSILLIAVAKILYRMDVIAAPGETLGEGAEKLGWGIGDPRVFQVKDATFALREGPIVEFIQR